MILGNDNGKGTPVLAIVLWMQRSLRFKAMHIYLSIAEVTYRSLYGASDPLKRSKVSSINLSLLLLRWLDIIISVVGTLYG